MLCFRLNSDVTKVTELEMSVCSSICNALVEIEFNRLLFKINFEVVISEIEKDLPYDILYFMGICNLFGCHFKQKAEFIF